MDSKICINCMSSYDIKKDTCPFCGFAENNNNPIGSLPMGTVLVNKYTISKYIEVDGEGISYFGIHNELKCKIIIKEFFPITLCNNRIDSDVVSVKNECEVLYKTNLMDFTLLYKTLFNLKSDKALLQVLDVVSANNTTYAIMEYVEGITLEKYLEKNNNSISYDKALRLIEPILIGLEKLHRLNWLHLGISPANIIITKDERVLLKGYAIQSYRTTNSELKSLLYSGYSSPEQYSIIEYKDSYSDIYSISAVIYRMISGKKPQSARERGIIDNLQSISTISNIPKNITTAINCALRLSPAERYSSVEEFRLSLFNKNIFKEPKIKQNSSVQKNNNHKFMLWILTSVIFLALVFFTVWYLINFSINNTQNVPSQVVSSSNINSESENKIIVNSYIGQMYKDVIDDYPELQFEIIEEVYHDSYSKGTVVKQSIEPNTTYNQNDIIELTISKGAKLDKIPDVVGLNINDVIKVFDDKGIKYLMYKITNDGTDLAGNVIKTDPYAGVDIDPLQDTVLIYYAGEISVLPTN